jgi:DNA invertase Pin-like site-specific DNA recombinase
LDGEERLDAYIRISRRAAREGESYISPSVQREAIERWASYKGVTILEWHKDEDWSGGTHQRPGLERAVKRCLAGETSGIVSANIDRFSRTTELGLRDLRRLEDAGARLAFVHEDIDTGSVYGKMIYTILLAVAEAFLANVKASWQVAKQRAVKRGAYVSRTPWGYQRNEDSTLSPHPERAPIVEETFRLAAGQSIQAAMAYLEHIAPERRWTTTKVRRLLSQRSYLGETRNGGIVQAGTHEPIVSLAIWEAAQTTPSSRKPAADFPLSGIIACATCEQPMVGSRGGRDAERTYRCAGGLTLSRSPCKRPALITARLLENHIQRVAQNALTGLRAIVGDPEADRLTLLERAVTDAEAELDAFAADLTLRRVLGDRYHNHLQARTHAVERARAAYRSQAREAQESLTLSTADLTRDPELLPVLLRSMFDLILVKPGRGTVTERVRLVPVKAHGTARVASSQGS